MEAIELFNKRRKQSALRFLEIEKALKNGRNWKKIIIKHTCKK